MLCVVMGPLTVNVKIEDSDFSVGLVELVASGGISGDADRVFGKVFFRGFVLGALIPAVRAAVKAINILMHVVRIARGSVLIHAFFPAGGGAHKVGVVLDGFLTIGSHGHLPTMGTAPGLGAIGF